MHADLQRLTADNLLANVGELPMERLRAIRAELTAAESDISMVRRMTQGRQDIVGHGLMATRQAAPGEPEVASELLFDMPDILSEGPGRTSRGARIPDIAEPGPLALELIDRLDRLVAPSTLSELDTTERAVLDESFERLRDFEVELSGIRRSLHERIDAIQGEIARRYRDGEASVDALLSE